MRNFEKSFFEFRILVGKKFDYINNDNQEDTIWQSLRSLHDMGPHHVIISSISAAKISGNLNTLQMRASSKLLSRINLLMNI